MEKTTVPEKIVAQFLTTYKDTAFTKDVMGHLKLYDADILAFDMWENWSIQGIDAMSSMVKEWFGSLGEDRVVVQYEDAHTTVVPEMILATALVKYSAVTEEGKTLRYLQNRLTWVLKLVGTEWKIIHQHTSSPIDENMKAILKVNK